MSIKINDPLRIALAEAYRSNENQAVHNLIAYAKLAATQLEQAQKIATDLVIGLRKQRIGKGGLDAFLSEYNLSTQEGIALMCIAESMLRIPDQETIDKLIKDKIIPANWEAHIGKSESLFVNAATWSLMLTGKIIIDHEEQENSLKKVLKSFTQRSSEPLIRKAVAQAMKILGKQFVMGQTIAAALTRARSNEKKGYRYSYDMLGEGARTIEDAQRYWQAYADAIHAVGHASKNKNVFESPGVSVKLSALYPRYEFAKHDQVLQYLVPKVLQLAELAKQYEIGFTIDAEESERLDLSLDIIEKVFASPTLNGWEGFGLAVQAYQKRCFYLIDWLVDLSRRFERRMMVRLVKGAYWDSEIKQSQVKGYDGYPVFTRKSNTDVSYIACAKKMLAHPKEIYPQFATHNAYSVAVIMQMAADRQDYEFQCLHGMGQTLYDQIVGRDQFNIPCRVYAPVGSHKDLLPYLVRRLLENGANSSFVNRIVNEKLPIETLIVDPVAQMECIADKHHPHIPLPQNIYGEDKRLNSHGIDLSNPVVLAHFEERLAAFDRRLWDAKPTLVQHPVEPKSVTNPMDLSTIGQVYQATEMDLTEALAQAKQAQIAWQQRPLTERAEILRMTADLLEQHKIELYALLIREGGKTINDAISEVREAVDFCRYYAWQAEQLSAVIKPLGVVLCISPWNFPLAIFLGQVSAALVTGNAVLAKPSEQTPLIAARTVELLHRAGVPLAVIQLIPGRGSVIGAKLVSNPDVRGILFTGSTETAQLINRTIAKRGGFDVPFVAETGGQNAMIVDSSALPEQVIDDAILSAFGSAGQRCSALRVLFIQEDIADSVIHMLRGAMMQLQIGDPRLLTTDVGPVIDKAALETLEQHAEHMKVVGKLIYQCELDSTLTGHFFAPLAIEIDDLSILTREVFGPILHVIRYKESELDKILTQIKMTGYGLTMGIHSRIETTSKYIYEHSAVGNTYVNRNMIGAVVGVQPFGGEGLSGTGPKAGGPHYLRRLCHLPFAWPNVIDSGKRMMANDKVPARSVQDISHAIGNAKQIAPQWQKMDIDERIAIVIKVADLLHADQEKFITLLKTPEYGHKLTSELLVAEWKNGVDVTQFYLTLARAKLTASEMMPGPTGEANQLTLYPRGLIACITPWCSPIAASMGQISAALLAGNRVIVKPAQQTSAIVLALADLFYQAGLPKAVLQVIPGAGDLGEHLIHAREIDAVMFSGDDSTAKKIKQALAARDGALIPLILLQDAPCYLERVTVERTLTINTTANGGNAALLSLSED